MKLSGIGRVAVRWHRPLQGAIKTVRISKKAGKWYACFSCEVAQPQPLPKTGRSVGIDVGLTHKAASVSREIVLVDPHFTSKICSNCRYVFEHLTLADRWVVCDCGLSLDRDHNAAINIRNRAGHARWGQARHEPGCPKKPPDFSSCGVSQPTHCDHVSYNSL